MTEFPDGLEQLRTRVKSATSEINRLKADNEKQAARLDKLKDKVPDAKGPALYIDGDRDALRKKVRGYIETIDRFLKEDAKS